jgi:L-lysine 6-transaminase
VGAARRRDARRGRAHADRSRPGSSAQAGLKGGRSIDSRLAFAATWDGVPAFRQSLVDSDTCLVRQPASWYLIEMVRVAPGDVHATLGKWILTDGLAVVCDLSRSDGAYLHDAKSGTDFLDFFGFFGSRPLSFNHPGMRQAEFQERLREVALYKPSNCDVYTEQYASFVDVFGCVVLGGAFDHLFFIVGGGAAVDNAVKAAIDWKHRKNIATGRGHKGNQVIHFAQGFHGRTGYALSLTESHDIRKTQYFPVFDWPRVLNPKKTFPFDERALADVEVREHKAISQVIEAFDRHPDDIAGVIIEPIQSEGGDNHFRSEFLQQLRRLCDEREALLIFDEVQTGFGATGAWWDWENHGVKPDLMVFGKKCQVCGVAATARLDEVDSVFSVPSRISSTFAGNLVDMVRCQRVVEIVQEQELLTNAANMGKYILHVLAGVADSHPEITGVRGRGVLAAFDVPTTEERDGLVSACYTEELLVLPCGERSIRLRPALDISADAIGRAGAQLEAAICRAYGKPR